MLAVLKEGVTQSVGKYLLSLVDQGFVSAGLFIATFALARHTSPEGFGPFAITRDIVVFFAMIQVGVVLRPLSVIGNQTPASQRDEYTASCAGLQQWYTGFSILGVAGWMFLAIPDLSFDFLAAALLFCVGHQLREFRRFQYLSDLSLGKAAAQSATYLLAVVLGVIGMWTFRSFSPLLTASLLGSASLVAWSVGSRPRSNSVVGNAGPAFRKNFPYSFWEVIGSTSNFIYVGGIPLCLGALGRLDEAGGFIAARTLYMPIQTALVGIYNVMVPLNAAHLVSNRPGTIKNSLRVGVLLWFCSLFLVVPLLLFGDTVLITVFNSDYSRFSTTLGYLGVYFLMLVPSTVFHSLLLGLRRPESKALSQAAGMLVGVTILAISWGDVDAKAGAIATMCAEATVALVAGTLVVKVAHPFRRGSAESRTPGS